MSKTITLTEKNALNAYKAAPPEFKPTLEKLFEGQVNFVKSWKDMTSFEDACEVVGEDPNNPRFHTLDEDDNVNRQMKVVMKAYNGDWKPDWTNTNQRKWYIWWEFSGAGFQLDYVDFRYSFSSVGSRLSFESEEKARHAATKMTDFFNKYLIQ